MTLNAMTKEAKRILMKNPQQNAYILLRLMQGGIKECWIKGESVCLRDREHNKYLYSVSADDELIAIYEEVRRLDGELVSFLSDAKYLDTILKVQPDIASTICLQLKSAPYHGELPEIDGVTFRHVNEEAAEWIPQVYKHPELTGEFIRKRVLSGPSVAAWKDEKPVGFFMTHSDAELGPVYISPEMRGSGLSAALYARMMRQIKDSEAPILFVVEGNTASLTYLTRLGCIPAEKKTCWWWRAYL